MWYRVSAGPGIGSEVYKDTNGSKDELTNGQLSQGWLAAAIAAGLAEHGDVLVGLSGFQSPLRARQPRNNPHRGQQRNGLIAGRCQVVRAWSSLVAGVGSGLTDELTGLWPILIEIPHICPSLTTHKWKTPIM
jgi:hypothetical protein